MLFVTIPHETRTDVRATVESVPPASLPSEDVLESMPADYFIENEGQLGNQDVRFYTTSGDMQIGFAESAVLFKLTERTPSLAANSLKGIEPSRSSPQEQGPSRGVLLRLGFEGANRVTPQGRDPLPFPTNFFIGNDPARWKTNVRSYREVVYEGLYDGVDLAYRATDRGAKYDFIVAPGTDVGVIKMSYEGADGIEMDADGSLLVHTTAGDVGDSSPIAYQGNDDVQCSFVSLSLLSYGFVCDGADRSRELVIDPLLYSTYLGGSNGGDYGDSIAIDSAGNAYVVGKTSSTDLPVTSGAFNTTYSGGFNDVFVAKLDSSGGSLLYLTYLGGAGDDRGDSIALDSAGNAYVTGFTRSADFPVTSGAFDTTYNGLDDAFVAKLDSTGSSLLYSTYLGGGTDDPGESIAVDSAGNAYVTGLTDSTDFPVTSGAFDTTYNGSQDAFVAKLDSTGSSLIYATYLGGGSYDEGFSIAVNSAGNAYVTGYTISTDFPVTSGAFNTTGGGQENVFVAKLDSTGGSLLYSTYLGGAGPEYGQSIVIDSAGNAYVSGRTRSADFPVTSGAFDTAYDASWDVFVAKLDSTGSSLLYSTYLGGGLPVGSGDYGESIAIDSVGNAYVTGFTDSEDFPVTSNAFDMTLNGNSDAFVAKLDSSGSSLLYSTYLGGDEDDRAYSIATDSAGKVYLTGYTASTDFPVTSSAFNTTYNGWYDAFVVKMELPNTPPTTSITAPSGGEVWTQGDTHSVNWTATDNEDAQSALLVWVNYTSSAGNGNVCGPVAGNVGTCAWTLPMITATDVVVNGTVIDTDGLKGYDESGQFTIQPPPSTPPTVTITSPTGGEEFLKGSSHTITWTMHDDEDINANLTIYINYTTGGVTSPIVAALKGQTSFAWTLPDIEANDVVVNITVIDSGGLKGWSQSGPFTIKAPPSPPPDFLSQYWWLVVVIVAVVIVLLLLALMKRRKPKEEEEEVLSSEHQNPPPGE
jgi:hypothetical protein